MDAVKILGSLLNNNALGSQRGGSILDSLLGSGGGNAGDILTILLGGQKRSSSGGLGALGGLLAAAAGSRGGKGGKGLDLLGSLLSGAASSGKLGGLGSLFGGGAPLQSQTSSGGLGDLVGAFLGGGEKPAASSGGGGLLGSLLGGGGAGALSSILGAASAQPGASELLGLLTGGGAESAPPAEAQEEAEILIEAMCNAAKCDGSVDDAERELILGRMGDLDAKEVAFLKSHLASPVDVNEFVSRVPADMAEQVYAFSLMAIKLDTQSEAEYFGQLAQGLGLDGDTANKIHESLGQPEIFA
jgi:uncharacterized membrane protein YebE (DUF533 family)